MNTYIVMNLDTGEDYYFVAETPYEAMRKMIYTLNLKSKCDATINKSRTGKHLYIEHNGHTYAVSNR